MYDYSAEVLSDCAILYVINVENFISLFPIETINSIKKDYYMKEDNRINYIEFVVQ